MTGGALPVCRYCLLSRFRRRFGLTAVPRLRHQRVIPLPGDADDDSHILGVYLRSGLVVGARHTARGHRTVVIHHDHLVLDAQRVQLFAGIGLGKADDVRHLH